MAPQRRKHSNLGLSDEDKPVSKKAKNSLFSSFYTRRASKSSSGDNSDSSFSSKRCLAFFAEYATPNDAELIGPEGIERFCKDLCVQPEDIVMLVLAWKMEAKQMGYFTLKEWTKGLTELQCDSLIKLRNKLDFLRSLLSDNNQFKSIFRYAFDFTRDKDQRSIDIDIAKIMLSLLLSERWPMYPAFHRFLEESKYKVINKDQWCNVLEFSRVINLDLSNYDEDGAWPVLLDEFVDWYRRTYLNTLNTDVSFANQN